VRAKALCVKRAAGVCVVATIVARGAQQARAREVWRAEKARNRANPGCAACEASRNPQRGGAGGYAKSSAGNQGGRHVCARYMVLHREAVPCGTSVATAGR